MRSRTRTRKPTRTRTGTFLTSYFTGTSVNCQMSPLIITVIRVCVESLSALVLPWYWVSLLVVV